MGYVYDIRGNDNELEGHSKYFINVKKANEWYEKYGKRIENVFNFKLVLYGDNLAEELILSNKDRIKLKENPLMFWHNRILTIILKYFNLRKKEFFKNIGSRKTKYLYLRHLYVYFMYKKKNKTNNITYASIGALLKKNHATIINAYKRMTGYYNIEKKITKDINILDIKINTYIKES